ncbi:MAG TPA: type I phosphomannose isomerase catalytic subunit [Sedimentisphaerales bacterium]|nr:type I phosphomannose isomerase catalytic subunit [Sedimentisphaerales bacterium]
MDRCSACRYNARMKLYPFKLKPIYKHRIWGGQKLREVFGKDIPEGEKIGESWELADLPEDKSVIANGELAGQTLISVVEKYPQEITGDANFRGPFPLLIKFINAEDVLSVQVHPDPQTCRRMGKGDPKTECWYIISAEPGAVLYKGLKSGVTREAFAEAIRQGTVAELLGKVTVNAGECHFLPAGTAHSIGAGLLIAEIQTPSDTTYRVFDWNRVDDSGRPRQLHIEEALESINFEAAGEELAVTTIGRLADCEYFKIDKGHQAAGCEALLSAGMMKTLIMMTGRGRILGSAQGAVDFEAGDCLLIPADFEGVIKFVEDTEYMTITI